MPESSEGIGKVRRTVALNLRPGWANCWTQRCGVSPRACATSAPTGRRNIALGASPGYKVSPKNLALKGRRTDATREAPPLQGGVGPNPPFTLGLRPGLCSDAPSVRQSCDRAPPARLALPAPGSCPRSFCRSGIQNPCWWRRTFSWKQSKVALREASAASPRMGRRLVATSMKAVRRSTVGGVPFVYPSISAVADSPCWCFRERRRLPDRVASVNNSPCS